MKSCSPYDISSELLIQRYRGGIHLVRPSGQSGHKAQSIAHINQLGFSSYFYDLNSHFVGVNEDVIESIGAESYRDLTGKHVGKFIKKRFTDEIVEINNSVIRSSNFRIAEENGNRNDNSLVRLLSIKFPWYFENRIVGLFGFSILLNGESDLQLANKMMQITETGLLSPYQNSYKRFSQKCHEYDFTNREKEVLQNLIRGRSPKEIAADLFISHRTVEHHIENLRKKSQTFSKSQLIAKFID